MKDTTIYTILSAAFYIIAAASLIAVFLGYNHHLYTLAASGTIAYLLQGDTNEEKEAE